MSATEAASAPLVSLHTHTNLSRCAKPEMTLDAAVALAVEHDYRALGFSDHVHIAERSPIGRPMHSVFVDIGLTEIKRAGPYRS